MLPSSDRMWYHKLFLAKGTVRCHSWQDITDVYWYCNSLCMWGYSCHVAPCWSYELWNTQRMRENKLPGTKPGERGLNTTTSIEPADVSVVIVHVVLSGEYWGYFHLIPSRCQNITIVNILMSYVSRFSSLNMNTFWTSYAFRSFTVGKSWYGIRFVVRPWVVIAAENLRPVVNVHMIQNRWVILHILLQRLT